MAQLWLAALPVDALFATEVEDDLPNGFFDYFDEVYCEPKSQYLDFYFFFDFYSDSECVGYRSVAAAVAVSRCSLLCDHKLSAGALLLMLFACAPRFIMR